MPIKSLFNVGKSCLLSGQMMSHMYNPQKGVVEHMPFAQEISCLAESLSVGAIEFFMADSPAYTFPW